MAKKARHQDRTETLTARRNEKMAESAHAYVRGSTVKFYQWLDDSARTLPAGPPVWICGDCHIGNLGPLADTNGRVAVQIRDLDQTVLGNPVHDLVRLALSISSAARGCDLPGVTTAKMLEAMMAGYEQALDQDYHDENAGDDRPKLIKDLLRRSTGRKWRHLAEERLDDVTPQIPLGKRFFPPDQAERTALVKLFQDADVETAITQLQGREGRDAIELVDVAYWMKGCSSLGRLRYAALVRVGKKDLRLMDIKEAVTAAAPRADGAEMPRDNAKRVVAGANALSPNLGRRMLAARLLDRPVVIRELMPQDLKLEIGKMTHDQAVDIAGYLANVVGRAHGRQMDHGTRAEWRDSLSRNRQGALDAPSWLWRSVVELLAIHEAEYLEHCRRYALAA